MRKLKSKKTKLLLKSFAEDENKVDEKQDVEEENEGDENS